MLKRGWSDDEVKDLMGRNFLRVMDEADAVAAELQRAGETPSAAIWEARTDLPAQWGGEGNWFYPTEVQEIKAKMAIPAHDEL